MLSTPCLLASYHVICGNLRACLRIFQKSFRSLLHVYGWGLFYCIVEVNSIRGWNAWFERVKKRDIVMGADWFSYLYLSLWLNILQRYFISWLFVLNHSWYNKSAVIFINTYDFKLIMFWYCGTFSLKTQTHRITCSTVFKLTSL